MLELDDVTLCCIDTAHPALALRALRQCAAGIRFARTLFLTDSEGPAPGIEVRAIGALGSRESYSEFVLKRLAEHIATAHVLLIQWDGYVINPDAWRNEFLACDYIGAKWFWHDDDMRVGNGGFSLRSRKLLSALQDPRIVLTGNEDDTICRVFRRLLEQEHGIVFATEALADKFAFEAGYPIGKPFGFHGLYNFCRVVPPDELTALVPEFTPAIARSPQLRQLGRNCLALGQRQAAAAIFRRILEETPDDPGATAGLATATAPTAMPPVGRNDPCPCGSGKRYKHCHGATPESAAAARATEPASAERLAAALALHQRGDTGAAERVYREVLAAEPGHALAQHFLGVIEYQRGDLAAALPLLERSVAAIPNEPEFHNNLGLAYAAAERELDAVAAYRAALALNGEHAVAWNNLGLALQSLRDVAGAIAAFRRAVELKPDFAQARWNLALALLLDGHYEEGWREYDWRLQLPELGGKRPVYAGPEWDGALAPGKTLLVYCEQGLGDALQFIRYAAPLAATGMRVNVHGPAALKPLLATVPGVAHVSAWEESPPAFDAYFPLASLPRVCAARVDTITAAVPYVTVSAPLRAGARARLAAFGTTRKVGLAWAGSRENRHNRARSMPLAALVRLFDLPGISWFSLQKGDGAEQIAATPGAERLVALPADSSLEATAALIAELDLVISVCTSIAHLAGALGVPLWVMLCYGADWRWLRDREDSPWYPTARLFRQPSPRDWAAVVERVRAQLRNGR
jgi:tetratricopeptide (TPR) repeat protein